jgi:hypothetical protein
MDTRMRWEYDPGDFADDRRDIEGEILDDRELAGYYDADDGHRDRDREPGPFTRHADPLAPGPF